MTKLMGGWAMDRVLFTEAARKVLEVAIDHRRMGLILTGDAERGGRFKDNNAVLARLESMYDEVEFMANVGSCIDNALLDTAQSDYWYNHEKNYDDEYNDTENYDNDE